jgi:subtilisin family serine protease
MLADAMAVQRDIPAHGRFVRRRRRLTMQRILVFAALVTAVLVVAGPMPASAVEDRLERNPVAVEGDFSTDKFVAGEVLVGFHRTAAASGIEAARASLAASTMQLFPSIGARLWKLPQSLAVPEAIRILSANPSVRYAEPNYVVSALALPFDPLRNELWGLHNLGQTGGTADADIDALEAWDVETGTGSVVVGVIDTGVDYNHEELVGNIWTNPGEDLNGNGIADDFNGVDDDGNGFVDDLRGWDCINNDNDPMDDNNHGTHVSGTIGGKGDNGVGVVGVNWNVKVMPLKFLSAGGSGSNADAIECVNYAASFVDGSGNKVVRITSNSWGGGQRSNALRDAIAASGALFVAAAGNSGSSGKMYPAAYPLDNIISVAATDHNDVIASFSN